MQYHLFGLHPGRLIEKYRQKDNIPIFLLDHVNFDIYRDILYVATDYAASGKVGRPAYEPLFMFKILILQAMENDSDKRMEEKIRSNADVRIYLGLRLDQMDTPSEKTIWLFRERLIKKGIFPYLMELHAQQLIDLGFPPQGGQAIDSSILDVPSPHNTKEENVVL